MLAYVVPRRRGSGDRLLAEVATYLRQAGAKLAGAVQINVDNPDTGKCHMDLHVLSGEEVIRISQDLGAFSQGCRLDPAGLETAVGLAASALTMAPDIFIANKFGKQECLGRGFRPLIADALSQDIPVIVLVSAENEPTFLAFAEGMAERLPEDAELVSIALLEALGERRQALDPTFP